MSKKKFSPQLFHDVEIVDLSSEGAGVAKINDWVVFVEQAIPQDICHIQVYKKKHSFGFAKITQLVKPSPLRVQAPCSHFGVCGGCKLQNVAYSAQLQHKQNIVSNALKRLAKVEVMEMLPILGCEDIYYYRNKLDFGFSNKKWLSEEEIKNSGVIENRNGCGFHVSGAFDKVLDIERCHLQASPSNEIRNEVKQFALQQGFSFFNIRERSGFIRSLVIRTSSIGELMCVFSFYDNDVEKITCLLKHIQEKFPQITALLYVINQKGNDTIFDLPIHIFSGRDFIYEEMEGLRFKVGPKSFYQTNSKQAHHLYKITRRFAALSGHENVYDLYTGTGTIAQFVAKQAKKVVGVEYVPEAIADAKQNAALNKVNNASFFAGDMKEVLTDTFISTHGKPDVIITDPPRAGMHPDVVAKLLELAPQKIVYVSCNPSTQARDVAALSQKYILSKVQAVDMFPQTLHVECVILLELKAE
ncbi:MAG: 23S rRNA (uracil(1939)-C(5))-methyltransferase RlmD [Bacteroidetes bacterium]|nr:23S rRNA (uracil(1939)-C(5))-methyltransferase RlmD [Bacteroidota bacterium]